MSSPSVSVQWPQRQSHGSQETSSAAKAPVTSKPHNISPQKLHFCSEGVSKCGNMKQHVREFPSKLPQNKCSKRCQANLRCRHLSTQSMSDTRRSLSRRHSGHSGEVATWVRKFVKDVSDFLSFPLKSRAQKPWGNLMFPDLPASNGKLAITYQWGVSVGQDSASSNLTSLSLTVESRIFQQKTEPQTLKRSSLESKG